MSLHAAHLLPHTEALVCHLLIDGSTRPDQKLLGQLVSLDKQPPRLVAIVLACSSSSPCEPLYFLLDMLKSAGFLHLGKVLIEIVPETSSIEHFRAKFSSRLHFDYEFCACHPLFKSLFHHNSICHVSDADQLFSLSICRSNSHGLLSLLLGAQGVCEVLIFILQIFCNHCKSCHMLLVCRFLPLEQSFRQVLFV